MRALWIVSLCVACGGGGESPPIDAVEPDAFEPEPDGRMPDAPELVNAGFGTPTASLKANVEQAPGTWVEVGPADLSCLNTPSADAATTVTVAASTTVRDFQNAAAIAGATVRAFATSAIGSPFATVTSGATGGVTVNVPIGTARFGFDITRANGLRTLVFNLLPAPAQATQTFPPLRSFSTATAQTLPALVGIARTPNTAIALGVFRDCQGREVSNFVATVSRTAGAVDHVTGADTYYFSSSVGLPVRHTQLGASSEDGQFMVIELVPTVGVRLQIWGFPTDADLAADQLVLVAELPTLILEDTVSSAALAPLRQ
jgi:hypothetical protein